MTDTPRTPIFDENGWCHDMSAAPLNRALHIFVPGDDYYRNRGVYSGIHVNMGTGPRWMTFGWAIGRDLGPENQPTAWRYPPAPPKGV